RLDAVLAPRLAHRHLLEIVVAARQSKGGAAGTRLLGRRTQRPGHQLELIVDARRDAVHPADEGIVAPAHHAEADAAAQLLATPFNRHAFPPCGRSAPSSSMTERHAS